MSSSSPRPGTSLTTALGNSPSSSLMKTPANCFDDIFAFSLLLVVTAVLSSLTYRSPILPSSCLGHDVLPDSLGVVLHVSGYFSLLCLNSISGLPPNFIIYPPVTLFHSIDCTQLIILA